MLDMKMDVGEMSNRVEQSDIVYMKEIKECQRNKLVLRCKKAEEKCAELELEIQKKKMEYELLEGQLKKLEVDKSEVEEKLKKLTEKGHEPDKVCSEEEKRGVVNLDGESEEENKAVQLMIENSVLECEKKKAESEAKFWKDKFEKLETRILKTTESSVLEGGEPMILGRSKSNRGIGSPDFSPQNRDLEALPSNCSSLIKGFGHLQTAGTPSNASPYNRSVLFGREKEFGCLESNLTYGNRVRKQLNFEEESASKKMAPSTSAVSKPASHGIIQITNSDDELLMSKVPAPRNQRKRDVCVAAAETLSGSMCCEEKITRENNLNELYGDEENEEDLESFRDGAIFGSAYKRKRACNIVTSDTETESENEDDLPICKLKRKKFQETNPTQVSSKLSDSPASACDKVPISKFPSRRRLVPLRNCYDKDSGKRNSSRPISKGKNANEDVEDGSEVVGSELESEGESLGGFIVESSDGCDVGSASRSEDFSNDSDEYDEIISKLGRRKKEVKWDYEADMLAAFGKDPGLCMKAVCALYRQQTSEEKVCKEALFSNKRGFSKFDAIKGSMLAEFLTNGDPQGDLNKSVKELQEYDPKAIDLCRKLATHYSKQLFEIYKNKEDPFFLPA